MKIFIPTYPNLLWLSKLSVQYIPLKSWGKSLMPIFLFAIQFILFAQQVNAQCTTPNTTQYPSSTTGAGTGNLVTIATDSYEGEYSIINGIVNGASYQFTISKANDIITVRIGSSNGLILGFGSGNVTVMATSSSNLYVHWNKSNCGTGGGSNRTTTVQGVPTITSLGAASGCIGSFITINGTNLSGVVAANVTIGGTAVTSISTNTATQIIATIGSGTTGIVAVNNGAGAASSASSFVVNPTPTNLTPTAAASFVCSGTGTTIQIPGSQVGVNYQLRNNVGNAAVGSAVVGTGGNINLPTGNLTSTTTFNILATNTTTGCSTQLSTLVTVSMDNIAPTITCPAAQSINLSASCAATMPSFTSMAIVSDNCTPSGSIVVTQSPAVGTALSGAGTQIITLTATDATGNSSNCTFNLTKQDVTAPIISCPANITVNSLASMCGAVVNYTVTATDNCSGSTGCSPSSITNYVLVGTYGGHTYFRSNFSANWATSNANAIALGGHLLTLSSAGENNLFNGLGTHWAGFTDQAVEGTFVWVTGEPVVFTNWAPGEPNDYNGNEDYMQLNWNTAYNWNDYNGATNYPYIVEFDCASPTLTLVSGLPTGGVFPVGISTVTYNAVDSYGNTSPNCSFTVTVKDVTPPTILCPANINVNANAGACNAVVNYSPPGVNDNCGSCISTPAIAGFTSLGIFNGSAYYISNAVSTCPAAFATAASMGVLLSTVSSAAENMFIRNAATSAGFTGNYILGINDVVTDNTFLGASGEALSYFNWNAGEPNNYGGSEDYLQVYPSGVWNDIGAASTNNFIIEISCITPVKTSGIASGGTFPLGVSTINYSATDASGNTANCSFTVTVSMNPSSIGKTVTATPASICINTGSNITVALSDNGTNYQLRNNAGNTNVGSLVAGTGGTISLATGNLTSTTTFNILATNTSNGCTYQLTNTATITVNPLPIVSITGSASICAGATTTLSPSTGGTWASSNNAVATVTNAGVVTGVALGSATFTFTSSVGCSSTTPSVTVNALPVVTAPASVCVGSNITLSPITGGTWVSSNNAMATVTNAGIATGVSVGSVTFTFTLSSTGCSKTTSAVSVNALPTTYSITGGGSYCTGGSGVAIGINGSDVGTTYQLYRGATSVSSKPGTGSAVSFGNSIIAGAYTVIATTGAGCTATMTGTVTVSINSLPQVSVFSGNNICSYGIGQLTLTTSSGVGPFTVIYNDGSTNQTVSGITSGTAFTVTPTPASTINYTLFSVTDNNGCVRNSAFTDGNATITILATPADKVLSAVSTSVCSGSSTSIQINTSQIGVNYQLRNNATNVAVGSAVAGTGATISFPTATLFASTTFNVIANNVSTACTIQMSSTITVIVNPAGQWVGSSTGDWNVSTNWCGGVPTNSTNVNIPTGTTVNIQSANAVANSVTIAGTSSLVMTGAYNLNITAGGTFTNNGNFNATASTGTVAFLGNGTVAGVTNFKNIDTYGAINFGTATTISGIFSLQTGGSVIGNSPTYTCPTAVLLYKPGSTFTRGLEWTSSSSGAGYPANVLVQNNTTINFPVGGDGFICYDLTIDNGSSLLQNFSGGSASIRVGRNVNITGILSLGNTNGGDIYVGGNWIRNAGGIFNHNDRKVTFDGPSNFSSNGTSMSTITAPASAAKNNEGGFGGENFAQLIVNKTNATDSVVLLSNITVNREIGLTKGTFSLRNSDVTIVSNSTRTADIAPVTTPANINVRYAGTGRFVVQRFIQNPTSVRSWRLLTAPLQTSVAPSINEAWQEGVVNPDKINPNASGGIFNPWPGYGTHVTGPGGIYSALNGFDQGTNAASVLYANVGVTTWFAPSSNVITKITDQQGWMLFVRGDRSFAIGNQFVPSQNTTLEPKGKINIGDVFVPIAVGKQVIGNPYAAAISLLNVDVAGTAGKNSNYQSWDPKMFTSYTQPGKWVAFTGVGSSFMQTTSTSAYPSNGTIESGQAFVIDAAAAGTFTFHESDKLPLTSSLIGIANRAMKELSPASISMFRSDIYAYNNGVYKLTDGVLNIFDASFSNAVDEEDNKKLINFNTKESLSILRDSIKLAIEKRMDIQADDTIFFSMSKFNVLPYQFRFEANNFTPDYNAFLEDNFTGIRSPVSTTGVTFCNFTITADSLSKVANRFRIVFKSIVIPVTFTNIKAVKQNENIAVQWAVVNELNVQNYQVEKSTDSVHFEIVNTTTALGNNTGVQTYNWLDENIVNGDNYYRIKSTDKTGKTQYSSIVKVIIPTIKGSISLYPNPVTDGVIKLRFNRMEKGEYHVRLLNNVGQLLSSMPLNHIGGTSTHTIVTTQKIISGIYNIEIKNGVGEKKILKVIIK